MRYNISKRGAALITDIEKLRLESYLDDVKVWTIGFGTTSLNGFPVGAGMTINEAVAWALFYGKCREFLDYIEKYVVVQLNQNQVDALASFIYNIGPRNFMSSTLLQSINHKLLITESLFTDWNQGRVNGRLVVLNGLTGRRKKEYQLYMSKEVL